LRRAGDEGRAVRLRRNAMVVDGRCPATIGWAPCRTNRKNGAQHLYCWVFGNRRYGEASMLIPSARLKKRKSKWFKRG
jgi:hypothetical protein